MLLSRREALAGTAATVSMLAAPAVMAQPVSRDEPRGVLAGPPVSPPQYILDPRSVNCPPIAFLTMYKNDFGDGRVHYDSNDIALNKLAWIYEGYNYFLSPFSMRDVWKLFAAACLPTRNEDKHNEDKHQGHLTALMRDRRQKFFVADDITSDLGTGARQCLFFEKDRDWISFTSYYVSNAWTGERPTGIFKIRRSDCINL